MTAELTTRQEQARLWIEHPWLQRLILVLTIWLIAVLTPIVLLALLDVNGYVRPGWYAARLSYLLGVLVVQLAIAAAGLCAVLIRTAQVLHSWRTSA